VALALVGAWAAGVLVLSARWVAGWLLLRRLRRGAVPQALEVLAACRAEMGLRSAVGLAVHPQVYSPVLLGVWRPMVLVPQDWIHLPAAAQRAGLLHELAHIARGDHWRAPLLHLVHVAFFFHPAVRWLLARIECERELLCDEAAVARGVEPGDYARLLLEFARRAGRLAVVHFGSRHTVRSRIHHLLEEDMTHRLVPLPHRYGLLFLGVVLGAGLALGSLRLWAQEPQPPEEPARQPAAAPSAQPADTAGRSRVPKKMLRFDDKSFDQWQEELLTELKPQRRAEGLKAMQAFGTNGYGAEAVEVILEVVKGHVYTIHEAMDAGDNTVLGAGWEACHRIGDEAVGVLREGLKNPNRNVRRFAASALRRLEKDAQPAVPDLVTAIADKDPVVREEAIIAVREIGPRYSGFAPAILRALGDPEPHVRTQTALAAGALGPRAKVAVPALTELLRDPDQYVLEAAFQTLKDIHGFDAAAVPALADLLKPNSPMQMGAVIALTELGPRAKAAVPALAASLRPGNPHLACEAINALIRIGPEARAALPALHRFLEAPINRDVHDLAAEAIRKIEQKDK
jgi:hypothetical protein